MSRSSSTKEKEPKFEREKEKLHASPSTGSDDNVDLGVEEFDPFASSQAETDDIDGYINVSLVAPPETEYVTSVLLGYSLCFHQLQCSQICLASFFSCRELSCLQSQDCESVL